jgi:capsular polysaccharide export protein
VSTISDHGELWTVRAPGVARQADRLSRFLNGARFAFRPPGFDLASGSVGLAGWADKGGARREAARRGLPYLALEDGFLRGPGPGGLGWSLTADRLGVYYDASSPSELEQLIQAWVELPPEALEEGRALVALMRSERLGKYNNAPNVGDHPLLREPFVLVADQVRGDRSISGGGCTASTFTEMLDAARAENPGVRVIARVHPRRRRGGGHLREAAHARGLTLFDAPASWMSLADRAVRVYVATSGAGLEALIAGTPVTCFGLPFYAGWGLTDDRLSSPRRTARPPLEALVAAAYGRYSRYLSPLTGAPISALAFAELLALRRRRDRESEGLSHVIGVPGWKRPAVRPFLHGDRSTLRFATTADAALKAQAESGGRIVVWASKAAPELAGRCEAQGAPLVRLEDGFLRSVGLGAAMTPPLSLVLDRAGIYYDPSAPSDLETLLETAAFPAALLGRAAALRERIVVQRLSKYNVGRVDGADPFDGAGPKRRVLVPGQVEDDASVRLGCGEVRDNLGLLAAARAARPEAFIVFKPHPDVEAGLRPGRVPTPAALKHADAVVADAAMPDLLAGCDELHTMTSLAGFEALLRGIAVSTYGTPFYAGWGLTEDHRSSARRTRRLTLDELVAGTLLLYPRYADPQSGWPCSAEQAVDLLIERRARPESAPDRWSLRLRQALARQANRRSLREAQGASEPARTRAKA